MELVLRLGTMLLLLGVGVGARSVGVLTPHRRDRLNQVAFYVALPAVVFTSTYSVSLGEIVSVPLLGGLWIAMFGAMGLGWLVHRVVTDPGTRPVAIVQSYHANYGYLGVPIVVMSFGGASLVAGKAGVLLGVGALTQTTMTVLILVSGGHLDTTMRNQAREVATNPILLSLVVGLLFAQFGVGIPNAAAWTLDAVSTLALPIALLGVGSSLILDVEAVDALAVSAVVALKTVVMPLLAFGAFLALGASETTIAAGVVMTAMPTAVSTYIYASELGGDERFASLNVFLTTVVALGTLFVVLSTFA